MPIYRYVKSYILCQFRRLTTFCITLCVVLTTFTLVHRLQSPVTLSQLSFTSGDTSGRQAESVSANDSPLFQGRQGMLVGGLKLMMMSKYFPTPQPCTVNNDQPTSLRVGQFECTALFNETDKRYASALDEARVFMARQNNTSLFGSFHDDYYVEATRDCAQFKTAFGYRTTLQPGDDPDFAIAYNVLVHKSAAQFERILRAIYRPHNSYCVHIDAKASEKFKDALRAIIGCFDNVFIASKFEVIFYAGYSRLQADINCMKDHLKSPVKWRYLLNTATNVFPLKTNAEITKILKIYNGANDIRGVPSKNDRLRRRWEVHWMEVARGNSFYLKEFSQDHLRPPPDKLTIVKGSAYGAFSRAFVEYLLTDPVAKRFLRFCRDTYSPDEHYWNTLHHTYFNPHINPPGSYSGEPAKKPSMTNFVMWTNTKCKGLSIRGHCLFSIADLATLVSQPEMMANRVDVTFEPLTIDCLEAWHRHKEQCPPAFNETFYRSLPFIYNNRTSSTISPT